MICPPFTKSPNCASHNHQRQRIANGVSELETEDGEFAQRAVENIETRLIGREVLHWNIARAIFGIVECKVALRERAAAGVFSTEPYAGTLKSNRTEGKRFAEGPIDGQILFDSLAAAVDEPAQLGMQMEIFGEGGDTTNDAFDHGPIDSDRRHRLGKLFGRRRDQFFQFVWRRLFLHFGVRGGQTIDCGLVHRLHFIGRDEAFADQALRVDGCDGRMLFDLPIKDGLRVAGIVGLVMAMTAIADQIDDNIALELLAVIVGDLSHANPGFGVVGVDVKDGRLQAA